MAVLPCDELASATVAEVVKGDNLPEEDELFVLGMVGDQDNA